jgi:phosphatidylserine decarboxylase
VKIAREGLPFVALFAAITAGAGWAGLHWLGLAGWGIIGVGVVLTGWCLWFFRDPERSTPGDSDAVICPADGVVCWIGPAELPTELAGSGRPQVCQRVCIFMNVFNVHVNRTPRAGVIEKLAYVPGKFFNASLDKASIHNERMCVLMRDRSNHRVAFVQIAGLVARRIVCKLKEGQAVTAGERFGLIRFGSRVDVYMPEGTTIAVILGQKTVAGETVIARLPAVIAPASQDPRSAEVAIGG